MRLCKTPYFPNGSKNVKDTLGGGNKEGWPVSATTRVLKVYPNNI